MSITDQLITQLNDTIRKLRFDKKQLARQCGRQGRTIYELRCALAEVRGLMDKRERGELRVSRDVRIAHGMLLEENFGLRRQIQDLTSELDSKTVQLNARLVAVSTAAYTATQGETS
jgi:predicted RNase H-like nuclease (RuvC/YqgF family)